MKLKLIAVLIATALIMGLFMTAVKISPVRAAGTCWIVDSLMRPGYNFVSLASALSSGSVSSGDHIFVRFGHSETLSANLVIGLDNLWIIGPPPNAVQSSSALWGSGPTPNINVAGFTILFTAANVFVWGLNITDVGPLSTAALKIASPLGGCTVQNNTITGESANNGTGIWVLDSSLNLIALNNITDWDISVHIDLSCGNNTVKLNDITPLTAPPYSTPPYSVGILLTASASFNMIYWNNLLMNTELYDTTGFVNYYDDSYTGGPGCGCGNWISVSYPGGSPPPYPVPPNNVNLDRYALGPSTRAPATPPIKQIPGDVNLDGTVNILDAILVASHFLTAWGQYGWDPRTDINGDGTVNILDAIILASHYLQHY